MISNALQVSVSYFFISSNLISIHETYPDKMFIGLLLVKYSLWNFRKSAHPLNWNHAKVDPLE